MTYCASLRRTTYANVKRKKSVLRGDMISCGVVSSFWRGAVGRWRHLAIRINIMVISALLWTAGRLDGGIISEVSERRTVLKEVPT